jgi:hypothetical protein
MRMQSLCHVRIAPAVVGAIVLLSVSAVASSDGKSSSAPDFPTLALVEYVQECMAKHEGTMASLYQCSCVIDEIAKRYRYDDYVEAATFARYATLSGERGAEFRDPEEGRKKGKEFLAVESAAAKQCGLVK